MFSVNCINNDGGESGEEEPVTGFHKQFSVIKNIHAGLVNRWDKSMDNSSSGLCRCLQEAGDHGMLEETCTESGEHCQMEHPRPASTQPLPALIRARGPNAKLRSEQKQPRNVCPSLFLSSLAAAIRIKTFNSQSKQGKGADVWFIPLLPQDWSLRFFVCSSQLVTWKCLGQYRHCCQKTLLPILFFFLGGGERKGCLNTLLLSQDCENRLITNLLWKDKHSLSKPRTNLQWHCLRTAGIVLDRSQDRAHLCSPQR